MSKLDVRSVASRIDSSTYFPAIGDEASSSNRRLTVCHIFSPRGSMYRSPGPMIFASERCRNPPKTISEASAIAAWVAVTTSGMRSLGPFDKQRVVNWRADCDAALGGQGMS